MNCTSLFGVQLSTLSMDELLRECRRRVAAREGATLCFVNAHTLTESDWNDPLRAALNEATFAMPDGMPLIWLARLKRLPLPHRVPGPEFMHRYLSQARGETMGFIGGVEEHAQTIAKKFGVQPVAYSPPYRPFSPENAAEDWRRFVALGKTPGLVWVGLGAPKQELWMREVRKLAPDVVFAGVGAAFDFLSDTKSRAPSWMQRTGLEWTHRLSQEPSRLWKRYASVAVRLVELTAKDLLQRPHR